MNDHTTHDFDAQDHEMMRRAAAELVADSPEPPPLPSRRRPIPGVAIAIAAAVAVALVAIPTILRPPGAPTPVGATVPPVTTLQNDAPPVSIQTPAADEASNPSELESTGATVSIAWERLDTPVGITGDDAFFSDVTYFNDVYVLVASTVIEADRIEDRLVETLYTSVDGRDWQRVESPTRRLGSLIVVGDTLWSDRIDINHQIWSTTDLTTWAPREVAMPDIEVPENAELSISDIALAEASGELWMSATSTILYDVFAMVTPFLPEDSEIGSIKSAGDRLSVRDADDMFIGAVTYEELGVTEDFLRSDGIGLTWSADETGFVLRDVSTDNQFASNMTSIDDTLFRISHDISSPLAQGILTELRDGEWVPVEGDPFNGVFIQDWAQVGDRTTAIGSSGGDPGTAWVTDNGEHWERREAAFRNRRSPQQVFGGDFFMIVGMLSDTAPGIAADWFPDFAIWASYDGIDWEFITPPASADDRGFGPAVSHQGTVLLVSQEFENGVEDGGTSVIWIGTVDE